MKTVSIYVPLPNYKKTKEIKTEIKKFKRQMQTVPKDDYFYDGDYDKNKINGKGKLFYKGKVKYQGEWKNGEFSGKGVLYFDNSSIKLYQGTFKKGVFNGKGTTYNNHWTNNKVQEEGYYKNGVLIKGKLFNDQGSLIREGNFKNGKLHGKGKIYNGGKVSQEGNFKDGKLNGKGTIYYENGRKKFTGTFKNGLLNGKGTRYHHGETGIITYEGNYKNDKPHGHGVEYEYDTGDILYDGLFQKGKRMGKGKLFYDDGSYTIGIFKNDELNGPGRKYSKDRKLVYEGLFKNDKKKGYGTQYYPNGEILYQGKFENDKYHGKGTLYEFEGNYEVGNFVSGIRYGKIKEYDIHTKKLISIHFWRNGINDGIGELYFPQGGISFKGYFKNMKKEGKGIEYNEDKTVKRKGVWKNNEFIGKQKKEENMRQVIKKQFKIKKFLQQDNEKHLQNIKPKDIKNYLKKYAKKEVKGNRKKLIEQLHKWRKQLNTPKENTNDGPMVFDAYEGGDVPIKEFLEDENRVLLLDEKGHYYGAYLEQCGIIYECQSGRSWDDYIGFDNVHSMIQFNTAEGPKFYFNTDIEKDLKKGYNLFHFKTEPKDLIALSKETAAGENIVSALHCDPKDIVKLSKVIKKEKIGEGLKKTVEFKY